MPIYGIHLKQYVNFTNNNVRDILAREFRGDGQPLHRNRHTSCTCSIFE